MSGLTDSGCWFPKKLIGKKMISAILSETGAMYVSIKASTLLAFAGLMHAKSVKTRANKFLILDKPFLSQGRTIVSGIYENYYLIRTHFNNL